MVVVKADPRIGLRMEQFTAVNTWLTNSYNIRVSADWLSACLEWIFQESEGQSLTTEMVKQQVFEQWLTSDLVEIGEPSLPLEAQTCDKMELISNYALQMISVVDVGFPLYGQQQKLMGRDNPNEQISADNAFQPAWEPKQSRMLLLTLTDGHTEIKAMEYQPIRLLHPQLPSGTKCVLSGTLLCRRGMVLLTEEHIHLLGGEVDTLTEVNSPLALLQQAMVKSREDEGKHAKQNFSGRFITRGSTKKLEQQRKQTRVKKEEPSCSSQMGKPFVQSFSTSGVKKESKPVTASKFPVKTEVKSEAGRVGLGGVGQGNHLSRDAEDEWEDDINYPELFDDDMDFDNGLTTNQKPPALERDGSNNSSKSFSCVSSTSWVNRLNNANRTQTPVTGRGIKTSCVAMGSSFPSQLPDLDEFDDDMEIEDIIDDSCPSWKPDAQRSLSCRSAHNTQRSADQAATMTKQEAISQHPSGQSSKSASPQILYQHGEEVSEFRPVSISPTFTSPASSSKQATALPKKKPLFKIEKPRAEQLMMTTVPNSGNLAKKQKIQAKVSDLFHRQSKATGNKSIDKQTESLEGAKVSMVDSSLLETSTAVTSATAVSSSGIIDRFAHRSPASLSKTHHTTVTPDTGLKAGESPKNLPRAVIQPFKTACSEDGSVKDVTSACNDLSDLNSPDTTSITVKAFILTLTERLKSNNGSSWSLACRISDNVTTFDVDISNGVLTGLIGFSAEESIAMRQRFKAEPELKEIFAEGLNQCQSKLISGRDGCVLELAAASRNPLGDRPIITKFNLSLNKNRP